MVGPLCGKAPGVVCAALRHAFQGAEKSMDFMWAKSGIRTDMVVAVKGVIPGSDGGRGVV